MACFGPYGRALWLGIGCEPNVEQAVFWMRRHVRYVDQQSDQPTLDLMGALLTMTLRPAPSSSSSSSTSTLHPNTSEWPLVRYCVSGVLRCDATIATLYPPHAAWHGRTRTGATVYRLITLYAPRDATCVRRSGRSTDSHPECRRCVLTRSGTCKIQQWIDQQQQQQQQQFSLSLLVPIGAAGSSDCGELACFALEVHPSRLVAHFDADDVAAVVRSVHSG